jgi:hypothetical protein
MIIHAGGGCRIA